MLCAPNREIIPKYTTVVLVVVVVHVLDPPRAAYQMHAPLPKKNPTGHMEREGEEGGGATTSGFQVQLCVACDTAFSPPCGDCVAF